MPSNLVKSMAKKAGVSVKEAEKAWDESVEQANKKFKKHDGRFWAYVNKTAQKKLNIEVVYELEKETSLESEIPEDFPYYCKW